MEKSMNILSPKLHAYIDYATVVIFLVAPPLLGMSGMAATIAYLLAGVHLIMSLVTDFELGAADLVPFNVHGWVERLVGPALIVLPYVMSFDATSRNFYLAMGVVIVLVGLFTRYDGAHR